MSTPQINDVSDSPSMPSVVEDRILRRREVLPLVGFGRTTLIKLVKAGTFPAPVRISNHAVGWKWSDVQRWISERPAA
jgi:prophage regulatory protein